MSKIISITEKKVARILKSLPSRHLLRYIETEDQLRLWAADRLLQGLVSQCWRSYFSGDNDPLEPALSAGELSQDIYDRAWTLADFYIQLWGLVQLTQPYIKRELEGTELERWAESAYKLFARLAWNDSNHSFQVCLKPYHEQSGRKSEKMYRLAAKGCEEELDPEQKKELQRLLSKHPPDWLMVLVLYIAKQKSSRSKPLRSRLEAFNRKLSELCLKEATISRKVGSFAWKNGEIKKASRYGGTYSS